MVSVKVGVDVGVGVLVDVGVIVGVSVLVGVKMIVGMMVRVEVKVMVVVGVGTDSRRVLPQARIPTQHRQVSRMIATTMVMSLPFLPIFQKLPILSNSVFMAH